MISFWRQGFDYKSDGAVSILVVLSGSQKQTGLNKLYIQVFVAISQEGKFAAWLESFFKTIEAISNVPDGLYEGVVRVLDFTAESSDVDVHGAIAT